MWVGIAISHELSKEELRSLIQAVMVWGKQSAGDKVVGFVVAIEPELSRQNPMPTVRLGPQMIVVGDKMLGTYDHIAITIAEATDKEIECFENASEIKLVKIMKG